MRRYSISMALAGVVLTLGLLGRASLHANGPDEPGAAQPDEGKLLFTNQVEGRTTILYLLLNGRHVKRGELLAELDSADLRSKLTDQEITTKKAEADLTNAQKTLEVAEIELKEFREGTSPQELERLGGDVALARSALELAEMRLQDASEQAKAFPLAAKQAEVDRDRAREDLKKAEKALDVLNRYTNPKNLLLRETIVDRCRCDMHVKAAIYDLEQTRLHRLIRQIAQCKVFSPAAGKVVHARDGDSGETVEGTVVRERQTIVRLIPDRDGEQP